MRWIMLVPVLVSISPVIIAAGKPSCSQQEPRTRGGLLLAEQRWVAALEGGDQNALACRLAPAFVDTNWRGQKVDRTRILAELPHRQPRSLHLDELDALVLGNVGIVHGRNSTNLSPQYRTTAVRFTDIFVRSNGRWRAISAQESLVASTSGTSD